MKEPINWWDDTDPIELSEFYDEHRTKQCHICGGWAIECSCDNEFPQDLKEKLNGLWRTD